MTVLTERFTHAVAYTRRAHAGQVRKGSGIPYLDHLLAESSLAQAVRQALTLVVSLMK